MKVGGGKCWSISSDFPTFRLDRATDIASPTLFVDEFAIRCRGIGLSESKAPDAVINNVSSSVLRGRQC